MMSLNVSKTELIAKALDQVDVNFLILKKMSTNKSVFLTEPS